MKNIYLRAGGVYWFSNSLNGKRVWINLHTKDLSEAVKKAEELRENPLSNSGPSLKDHIKEFIAYKLRLNRYTRSSAIARQQSLDRFCNWIGDDAEIGRISNAQIQKYYETIQRTVTESTAQSYMMALRSLFRWAVEIVLTTR